MMKNKKLVMASVTIAIAIICILFVVILSHHKANIVMKFSIYPSSISNSSYYLVLYDDATLKCFFGERDTDDIQSEKYMSKTRKSARIKLQEYEYDGLLYLADWLSASGFTSSGLTCDDWYYTTLFYKGTAYKEVYQHSQSEAFKKLSDELVWLSPIKIKGYSNVPGVAPQRVQR